MRTASSQRECLHEEGVAEGSRAPLAASQPRTKLREVIAPSQAPYGISGTAQSAMHCLGLPRALLAHDLAEWPKIASDRVTPL